MKFLKLNHIACGILSSVLSFAAYGQGNAIFSDDFETVGLFAEQWKAHGGIVPAGGVLKIGAGKSIGFKQSLEGKNYAVEAEFSAVPDKEYKGGHCGIILDGIHFMLRGDERWGTAWRPEGEKRSKGQVGNIPDHQPGKTLRFRVTREILKGNSQYTFSVNGKKIQAFQDFMPDSKTFAVYSYKMNMTLDNIQVFQLGTGNDSPNLVINGSFEYLQEGMPLFINAQTARSMVWKYPLEEFFKTFQIDTKEKRSGKNSLRMICNDVSPKTGFLTFGSGCAKGKPVTGSMWLKADKEMTGNLILWEKHGKWNSKKVSLTKDWKKYEFTVPSPRGAIICAGFETKVPGTVWADDVQIELGDKATEWRASSLDQEKFAKKSSAKEPARRYDLPRTGKKVDPKGKFDDFLALKPIRIDAFLHKGKEAPRNKMEAYALAGEQELYLGVRAYMQDLSKVKTEERTRDFGGIYGDDCVEIFLDGALSRKEYLQLASNASGSQGDMGIGRNPAWNGSWTVGTSRNSNTKSVDYLFAIPYADLASVGLSDEWGFNIGRNDTELNQIVSLLKTPQMNFHLPEIYPTLRFPAGVLSPFRIGLENAGFVPQKNGSAAFSATLRNMGTFSGKTEFTLFDKNGKSLGSAPVQMKSGTTDVSFSIQIPESARVLSSFAELRAGKRLIASFPLLLKENSPVTVWFGRNFYMKEKNASLFGTVRLADLASLKGELSVAGKKWSFPLKSELFFEFPLESIPIGNHKAELRILKGNNVLNTTSLSLKKLEWNPQNTPVDLASRALVIDGKPSIVVAPFFGIPNDKKEISAQVKLYHDAGFKTLMPGTHNPDGNLKFFIEECGRYGIKVLYWTFGGWKKREKLIPEEFFASIPQANVIGFLMVDEPELYAKSDEVRAYMDRLRSVMPRVPVFMNNTVVGIPARFANLSTDIVMIDDYLTNSETREMIEMVNESDKIMEAGASERKPGFFFHSGGNLHNHYRECTFDEQMAQGYGSIIAGLSGIAYFAGVPAYPENWRAMKQFNREMQELEAVILSTESAPAAVSDTPAVRVMTRKLGDTVTLIALNTSANPVKATLKLPAGLRCESSGSVRFENRNFRLVNGGVQDQYRPFERHVYQIKLKR